MMVDRVALVMFDPQVTIDARGVLDFVGRDRKQRSYGRGALVFAQGEPANAVFFIAGGAVKLTTVSTSGKKAVSAVLGSGAFFGEGALEAQAVRVASALTLVPSSILEVKNDVMERILRNEPCFAALFMRHLLARNARFEGDLLDQLLHPSKRRLARVLVLLADGDAHAAPREIVPKISQETLAEMVGTTRSRVSYFLNDFRKRGFIDYDVEMRVNASLRELLAGD